MHPARGGARKISILQGWCRFSKVTEGFFFADWVVHNGSAVLATKSVDENFVDADIHLTTTHTMTFNHTPGS